jgi:uncharacterized protein YjbJ (UPF0337 family)
MEVDMNSDRVKGKAKDLAGRVERQAGEWTGNTEAQVKGAMKQAEGKAQNAWGKAKDAVKKASEPSPKTRPVVHGEVVDSEETEEESGTLRRRTG